MFTAQKLMAFLLIFTFSLIFLLWLNFFYRKHCKLSSYKCKNFEIGGYFNLVAKREIVITIPVNRKKIQPNVYVYIEYQKSV